jgi:DNA repair protein RadC
MKKRSKIVDNTLFVRDEAGEYRIAPLGLVIERARTLLNKQVKTEAITSPDKARDWCMARLASLEHEVFSVVFLDNQHRVIAFEELFRGTIDGASVWPREVVKATLEHNAAAVIFSHNHHSGSAEPSEADRHITRRLKDVLAMIEVRVMDHIIVGGGQWYSFAQYGLL